MEARMQPRSEAWQHCLRFGLSTTPSSRVRMYQDPDGNIVHHFNIPGRHSRLIVTAEAFVEVSAPPPLPEALASDAWEQMDAATAAGEFWESLNASPFARPTEQLDALAREIGSGARRRSARHGSPDHVGHLRAFRVRAAEHARRLADRRRAVVERKGVCQDFAHIMIALVRQLGIPCRYVSGYLFQPAEHRWSIDGATHAWVEALAAGARLGGFRSDAQHAGRGTSHPRRRRPRLRRRAADARRVQGIERRPQRARRRRERRNVAGHRRRSNTVRPVDVPRSRLAARRLGIQPAAATISD